MTFLGQRARVRDPDRFADDTPKRGALVSVGDIPIDVPGVGRTLTAKRQAHHFTTLDQARRRAPRCRACCSRGCAPKPTARDRASWCSAIRSRRSCGSWPFTTPTAAPGDGFKSRCAACLGAWCRSPTKDATSVAVLAGADNPGSTTWRGLVVAAEVECMDYASANFRHSPSVEQKIADNLGGWWSPYDGTAFPNEESDIEHIVAKSEARDSGLCAASAEIQKRFTNDMDNLTLAAPTLNRYEKVAKDAAEWQPEHNSCWFAGRVLAVKLEYGLTVDPPESRRPGGHA